MNQPGLVTAGTALCCLAAPFSSALPQEAGGAIEEIVVTGTSIRGAAPVGSAVQAVDITEVRASGYSNINDVLKTIPQVLSLGPEEGRGGGVQSANSNITQAKTVNLRGLGTESTLVLVNGRRIVKNGTKASFYDLSVIPTSAIQRIEVITDGASAIYGADAVGGVVNIITRDGSSGWNTDLRYGDADGFSEWRASQTVGLELARGDLFLTYEHYERGGMLGSRRSRVTQDLRPFGGPDLRSPFGSPGTIVVDDVSYAIPTGQDGVGLTSADLVPGTVNREDINDFRSLLHDQTHDNVLASWNRDVGDRVTLFVEGYYSDRRSEGMGSSNDRGGATAVLNVPASNPFFVHPADPVASSVQVNYSFGRILPPLQEGGERGHHLVTGFSYDLSNGLVLDAFASWGKNRASRFAIQPHSARLPELLADPDPATAFNPFCDPAVFDCISPETRAALTGYNDFNITSRQRDFNVRLSGPLFAVWGGDLSMAVGAEYREESLDTKIEYLTTTPEPFLRGSYVDRSMKSVYGEVQVPFIGAANARPGVQRLNLSAAVRYDDYRAFGGTWNPKIGLEYDPLHSLTLRATYGTSFRAPSLADIDLAATRNFVAGTLSDPVTGEVVRALTLLGGRDGLGPEEATMWTFGVDFSPLSVPGLFASATYYDIDYGDRLTVIGAAGVLANPTAFADFIVRNPSPALVQTYLDSPYFTGPPEPPEGIQLIVDSQVSNLGGTKQSGLELQASYDFSSGGSDWTIGLNANYILSAEESAARGLPYVSVRNQINYPIKLRARAQLGWRRGAMGASLFLNHVGSYYNTYPSPWQRVGSWNTLDLAFGVDLDGLGSSGWTNGLRAELTVTNLTDASPPLVINTGASVEGGYDGQNASVIGRVVALQLAKRW